MPDDRGRAARYATVYRRGRTYVVTANRGSYRSPPYFPVDVAAADATVGEAVRKAVAGCQSPDDEPPDSEIREADAELFALAGVKDEATFARRASLVEIVER
jgi:hypothetical protein